MDLEGVMLSEISQSENNKYDFMCMWNLKSNINEQIKQKQTHRYREQTDGFQRGGGLGDWEKKAKGLKNTGW